MVIYNAKLNTRNSKKLYNYAKKYIRKRVDELKSFSVI